MDNLRIFQTFAVNVERNYMSIMTGKCTFQQGVDPVLLLLHKLMSVEKLATDAMNFLDFC